MKTGDITDAFLRALAPVRAPAAPAPPALPEPPKPGIPLQKGRPFLSEYHVRKALTPGSSTLTIPKDAIVSPLALEWLALKGIRIVHSS